MVRITGAFDFVDGGRAYACHVEEPRGGRGTGEGEAWWWFGVAGDAHRYAPFRAAVDDTEASVHARVVAYYEDHIARRGWMAWYGPGDASARSGRARSDR